MKKLKLSTVYFSLMIAGVTFYSPTTSAIECGEAVEIKNESNAILSQCNYSFEENKNESWLTIIRPFLVENSTFELSNSNLNMKNYLSDATFLKATDSKLNISNSTINAILPAVSDVLKLKNTPTTIKNSTLTSDDSTVIDLNGGNLNIENSTLGIKNRIGALINVWLYNSNNIDLKNVKGHSNQLFEIWLYSSEPDKTLHINIDNSKLLDSSSLISFIGNQKAKISLTASNNSEISGGASIRKFTKDGVTFNIILNDSLWSVVRNPNAYYKDSSINSLHLNNSSVNLVKPNNTFHTFTIYNDLSGNGNFILNTDLASQQSDKIIVKGSDSGSFGLNIRDSGNEPNAANGRVTLVETATGTAKFTLLGKDYVDAGAYRYRLNQEGNNWVLSNNTAEKAQSNSLQSAEQPSSVATPSTSTEQSSSAVTPSTSTEQPSSAVTPSTSTEQSSSAVTPSTSTEQSSSTVTPSTSTEQSSSAVTPTTPTEQPNSVVVPTATPTEQVALSEKSNALVSLRQAQLALVESSLEGLHQRLGEIKNGEKGNLWVRNINSRNRFASTETNYNSRSSGFEQDSHTIQLGVDTALSDNFRIGGFMGNSRSHIDFNGEYSSGKVRTQSLGVYGTYLADNGFYLDNIAKYEYVKANATNTGNRKYNAYTLSSEIGRIHQLRQGWLITPQLQAAWTTLSGLDDEDRISAITARAGVRIAKAFELAQWKLQPYTEINAITTQTNRHNVRVNQYSFDVAESKGRIQTLLGMSASLGNHRVSLEGSLTNGKRLDQPYKVQVVYRYSW